MPRSMSANLRRFTDYRHAIAEQWTFLSNHAHVLLCIARNPEIRIRDIADQVGITERAVTAILDDLDSEGYVNRSKVGRRNRYKIQHRGRLRHQLEARHTIGELIDLLRD